MARAIQHFHRCLKVSRKMKLILYNAFMKNDMHAITLEILKLFFEVWLHSLSLGMPKQVFIQSKTFGGGVLGCDPQVDYTINTDDHYHTREVSN